MFSPRLRHVLTRADLAYLLAPTYAASANVDFDEALERMQRAVTSEHVAASLYDGLSAALEAKRGTPDEVIDKLSAGVQKRRSRIKAVKVSPAISAVMVMLDLEIGFAPEMMRDALENPKGKALLAAG